MPLKPCDITSPFILCTYLTIHVQWITKNPFLCIFFTSKSNHVSSCKTKYDVCLCRLEPTLHPACLSCFIWWYIIIWWFDTLETLFHPDFKSSESSSPFVSIYLCPWGIDSLTWAKPQKKKKNSVKVTSVIIIQYFLSNSANISSWSACCPLCVCVCAVHTQHWLCKHSGST